MTIDSLSEIVAKSLSIPDLSKLTVTDRDKSQGHKKAVASLIPYVGGAAAEELQMYYDYKDDEFFRKFVGYLMELKETTAEERNRFAQDVQEIAEDFSGNVICGMVDRLDNINKEKAFAKLTVARIHGLISIQDFFRLHSLLERIPYMDLKELPKYKEPFYDETGDTELLFATGALELDTIDTSGGSNKYKLSRLGSALLRWGFGIHLELEHGKGTNVDVPTMTPDEVEEIVKGNVEKAVPKVVNEALEWEEIE
jgi:hypothetical protein